MSRNFQSLICFSVKAGIKQYKKDHKNMSRADFRAYELTIMGMVFLSYGNSDFR